jgi:hypothetical protein
VGGERVVCQGYILSLGSYKGFVNKINVQQKIVDAFGVFWPPKWFYFEEFFKIFSLCYQNLYIDSFILLIGIV